VPDGQGRRGRGKAFKLTLICQGHEHLKAAGLRAVCGHLMAK
jgi:hypothetical protein